MTRNRRIRLDCEHDSGISYPLSNEFPMIQVLFFEDELGNL
jgi:hypothetical protein